MKAIEIIARAVCVSQGHILLCRTGDASNTYLPGGHVEYGEGTVAALAREIKEELGVTSKVTGFLGAVEHHFDQAGERHCEINLCFGVRLPLECTEVPLSREDHISFIWHPVEKLPNACLEPAVLVPLLLEWLKRGSLGYAWASNASDE